MSLLWCFNEQIDFLPILLTDEIEISTVDLMAYDMTVEISKRHKAILEPFKKVATGAPVTIK